MARSVTEIKEQIAAAFMADEGVRRLYGFKGTEQFSKIFPAVCVESVMLYVFALGMWMIESLFDSHRAEVDKALAELRPHTLRWYISKAKAFQINDELPIDESGQPISDTYAVAEPKKQIVRYAVADEVSGLVLLKVAKYKSETDHRPDTLQQREVDALRRYFSQIKDGGVSIAIMSNAPDSMALEITIHYNAMALHVDTKNSEPDLYNALDANKGLVRMAVESVIENLPFDGMCRKSDLIDAIYKIDGVDVADITRMQTAEAGGSYVNVTGFCCPKSGYFKLDTLKITPKIYVYGS